MSEDISADATWQQATRAASVPHHRGREIPWLNVVQFHQEIARRAEEGFFSLNDDDQSDRWSSIGQFEPEDLAGPWEVGIENLRSVSFRLGLEQGQHETIFLGGPCYVGHENVNGKWYARWRPVLYREVEVKLSGKQLHLVPRQAHWQVSPLILAMLDRLQVRPEALDTLADEIIEKAGWLRGPVAPSMTEAVMRALLQVVPDVEEQVTREIKDRDFRVIPSPWVLFAPTNKFSALTRYLLSDYEALEKRLKSSEEDIGGLSLLEDRGEPSPRILGEPLPVVPLNTAQEEAVRAALGNQPLTVISGPPGCGKSQVVVSLLLNCWATGTTALFASNNNKAVDVVRERLERFESEFPIAARAGARKYNNVQEVLRRTLNMASAARNQERTEGPSAFRKRKESLRASRRQLEWWLDSKEPQRIDEALRAGLTAYSKHRSHLAEINSQETDLAGSLAGLGLGQLSTTDAKRALEASVQWLQRLAEYVRLRDQDSNRRRQCEVELAAQTQKLIATLAQAGVAANDLAHARSLLGGPPPEVVRQWESQAREVFVRPLEQLLQPLPWRETYDWWSGEGDAKQWALAGTEWVTAIRSTCSELLPVVDRLSYLERRLEQACQRLRELGIDEDPKVSADATIRWLACWAEFCSVPSGRWDFLPWGRRRKLERELARIEQVLRSGLPVLIWARVGVLDESGRARLLEVLEACRLWIEARGKWEGANSERDLIDQRINALRAPAGKLRIEELPAQSDLEAWRTLATSVEDRVRVAGLAAAAWKGRQLKETTESQLRRLANQWLSVASGSAIKEAWRAGPGQNLDGAMKALAQSQSLAQVHTARREFYAANLPGVLDPWQAALSADEAIRSTSTTMGQIPDGSDRLASWQAERPEHCILKAAATNGNWPTPAEEEAWSSQCTALSGWCHKWETFQGQTRPALLQESAKERDWALKSIRQAFSLLPPGEDRNGLEQLVSQLSVKPEWPTSELTEGFRRFNPEIIRARIAGIDAELERGSFDDAKASWLERLATDAEAVQAVDSLEKILQRQSGRVNAAQIDNFRDALKLVPIWITTAQAPQAIPLSPGLFDLVVVDEASQCTLTNLLPVIFRAKRLVVIGDAEQLPAIPTIHQTEEEVLARKFDVENYLQVVGHACNDVFKTATESLPRRRGDVHMLVEHFRSHPLVIGFSNRHIYGQRLQIRKEPEASKSVPFGAGVHPVQVRGEAKRGERGRSWVNEQEGHEVLKLVDRVKEQAPHLSIGVVTPFAAHKDWLREQVEQRGWASEVLVDTAYGFQGDERDVIVFSAVVGGGITESACRWVESPPNLINVALTRAREALFIVADLDFCMRQEGILKNLAEYCRDVRTLRETSPAELALYSWMIVEGLTPVIHPRIGDHEMDFELKSATGIRVAVEVDGRSHHESHQERDRAIDAYLEGRGYRVIRVPARAALETPFDVVHRIRDALSSS